MADEDLAKADELLIGVKLKSGPVAYLRPEAVLGIIPDVTGTKLLLHGGSMLAISGSGGGVRRRILGLPDPEPTKGRNAQTD